MFTTATHAVLESLLNRRDDLQLRIAVDADNSYPNIDKLHEMSIKLALLECEIVRERVNNCN